MTKIKRIDEMNTIQIDIDDYCDYLQARYDVVKERWGGDASEALWEQFLELIRECGVSGSTNASVVVDNYLVNGDFCTRSEMENENGEPLSDEEWQEVCDDALIYDDKYACMRC